MFVEGPYGKLTGARRTRRGVTLIAGGIGITPLRALLEELPGGPGDLTLIYRARPADQLVFRTELDTLAAHRGAPVHYLVGIAARGRCPGAARAGVARRARSRHREREVYLCGPVAMMDAVRRSCGPRGPGDQVHPSGSGTERGLIVPQRALIAVAGTGLALACCSASRRPTTRAWEPPTGRRRRGRRPDESSGGAHPQRAGRLLPRSRPTRRRPR